MKCPAWARTSMTNLFNKKADMSARKMVFYLVFGFLSIIAFLFLVWLNVSDKSSISEIPVGLEDYLTTQIFLNSPSCFVLYDKDINRAYPWVIDAEKFNQKNLDSCYDAKDT